MGKPIVLIVPSPHLQETAEGMCAARGRAGWVGWGANYKRLGNTLPGVQRMYGVKCRLESSVSHGAPRGLVEDSVVADRASLAWLGILPTCLRSCVGRSASQHDGLGLPGLLIKYGPVVACSRAREAHRCVFLVYPTSLPGHMHVGRLYIPVCGSFYEGGSLPSVSFGLPGSGSGGRH